MIRALCRLVPLSVVGLLIPASVVYAADISNKIAPPAKSSHLGRSEFQGPVQVPCAKGSCSLSEFMEEVRVCALLVIKSGTIRFEQYDKNAETCAERGTDRPDKEYGLASVTKSITSTVMGHVIATKYGARTRADFEEVLQRPVDSFLPQLGKRVSAGGYGGVPIERVLNMRSGVRWDEYSYRGWFDGFTDSARFDWHVKERQSVSIVEFAKTYRSRGPKAAFNYSALDASINAAVAEEMLGDQKLVDFLESGLWKAIGAKARARWRTDYTGTLIGGCCSYMRIRDLARFGLLVLNDGRSPDGRQVIPRAWFDLATSHTPDRADSIPSGNYSHNEGCPLDYRFQWWLFPRPRTDFTAVGINGQFLHIYPDEDVLIVQISDWGRWEDGDRRECASFAVHDALMKALR